MAVLVLAHLMERDGELGEETKKRVDLAVSLFRETKASHFITTGWDYRDDSDLKIGEVIRDFVIDKHHLDPAYVLTDINSRDTVGDAYFVKRNIVGKMGFKRLLIVTSGYHVRRTREIFDRFYGGSLQIDVFGVDVPNNDDEAIAAHETASLLAFRSTFEGADLTSDEDIFRILATKHPFYNGAIYPSLQRTKN